MRISEKRNVTLTKVFLPRTRMEEKKYIHESNPGCRSAPCTYHVYIRGTVMGAKKGPYIILFTSSSNRASNSPSRPSSSSWSYSLTSFIIDHGHGLLTRVSVSGSLTPACACNLRKDLPWLSYNNITHSTFAQPSPPPSSLYTPDKL
jgi:hypothetical protein